MRRRAAALAASLLALGLAFANPWTANADHCNRLVVFTGVRGVGGFNAGTVGCTAGHSNSNRITPGSNYAKVRVTSGEATPVGGTLIIGDKLVELTLAPDHATSPTRHDSQEIGLPSSGDIKVAVQFDDGSEQTATYTR